jgi:prolipoprotein diacylglyceryltransferase
LPVHPLQLYFAAVGLLLIVGALWLRPRRAYPGQVALLALVVFSASTVVLERFRETYGASPRWGAWTQLEWTALVLTAVSVVGLGAAEVRHRRRDARRRAAVAA